MRRLVPATAVGSLLLLAGTCAMALGLGRVSTVSYLGHPLEFSIGLSAQPGDSLSPECISAVVYGGDARVPAEMVRVSVNRGIDGVPSSLRVTTGTRIDEPVASVELTLNCGTKVTRKYVVFIDPPQLNLAQAGGSEAFADSAATPQPVAREPRAARRSTRSNTSGTAGVVQAGGTGTASAARQRRVAAAEAARAARAAATTTRTEPGSRLKLESAPVVVAGAPVKEKPLAGKAAGAGAAVAGAGAGAASAAAVSASASVAGMSASAASAAMGGLLGELAAKADADALALSAERMRSLEERMNRLRADNQTMQKSMAQLQMRLQEAEANRYANPLVYGLLAALVLLLLAVIALVWRQASMRKESDWLKAAAADSDGGPGGAPRTLVRPSVPAAPARTAAAAAMAAGLGSSETAPGMGPRSALPAVPATSATASEASSDAGAVMVADAVPAKPLNALPVQPLAGSFNHEATSVHDPRREVTVEELIDLEQQADFFVVLGQDDAAIDLLMGHVQGTGGASPLPYLKLLEIHRRRDERDAYDRVRERFNRRFSAFAPEWEAHSGHDRALEDYPAVVERLQGLWPKPTLAMDALAALLFQRDLTAPTFDLPAYGELLFLYSLARELAESEPPPDGVDLLLPLDDGPGSPPAGRGGMVGLAALGAAGAAGAALAANHASELSLTPHDAPPVPELPPTYPVPLGFPNPGHNPSLDDGLLDLNISDDPEEPKGPLSQY